MSKLQELIDELCSDGVEYMRFDEACTLKARIGWQRLTKSEQMPTGEYMLITGTDFTDKHTIDFDHCCYVSKDRFDQDLNIQVRNGDLLVTKDGTLGKVAIVEGLDMPATLNGGVFVVRDKTGLFDHRFIMHYLLSDHFRRLMLMQSTGSTISHLTQKLFSRLKLPVVPIEVQREIVRVLDKYTAAHDELVRKLEEETALREQQLSLVRNQLLTFSERERVKRMALGELCTNLDSRRKPVTKSSRKPGPYPYYGASGIVDYVSGYLFDGEFLLVAEDGANLVARSTPIAFVATGKTWVNNHAHILEFSDKTMQAYVEIYLNSIDLTEFITGAAQPKLSQKNLNRIPIPVPVGKDMTVMVERLKLIQETGAQLMTVLGDEKEQLSVQLSLVRNQLLSFPEKVA